MVILAWLTARWAGFLALPPLARKVIAFGAALALCGAVWAIWLHFHDASVIREHEREITAEVERKTAAGNAAATEAAGNVVERIEAGNARASEAAKGSDDPLKAGLDSLWRK